MRFTPISSSSKGNAYLVEADGVGPLLLEAGLSIKQLREKICFNLSGLAGCLVSHEHGDHAKAVKDLLKAGVDCWMSQGTAQAMGLPLHHRLLYLWNQETSVLPGGWRVMPFLLSHDSAEPFGFLIAHGSDRLLFVPDTAYVSNRFSGITIAAVECNHVGDILSENIIGGHVPASVGRRVRRSHMSLETLIEMLKANDLSQCRQIWLLHLSDANSDEARMVKAVQEATGIPTYVAQ
ncbi:MAG: MBL fold metallo-hydrolase [Thermodesulfovibrionales bacterium]|jgi:phosphoribosyl 1,2-cyclic phosphodiesterase